MWGGAYFPALSFYKAGTVCVCRCVCQYNYTSLFQVTANFGPEFKHPPSDIEFRPVRRNVVLNPHDVSLCVCVCVCVCADFRSSGGDNDTSGCVRDAVPCGVHFDQSQECPIPRPLPT